MAADIPYREAVTDLALPSSIINKPGALSSIKDVSVIVSSRTSLAAPLEESLGQTSCSSSQNRTRRSQFPRNTLQQFIQAISLLRSEGQETGVGTNPAPVPSDQTCEIAIYGHGGDILERPFKFQAVDSSASAAFPRSGRGNRSCSRKQSLVLHSWR